MPIPYRTGLRTILGLLRHTCRLASKYRQLWLTFMTAQQMEKFDALVALCEEVTTIIIDLIGE